MTGSERSFLGKANMFFAIAILGASTFGLLAPSSAGVWASGFIGGIAVAALALSVYATDQEAIDR